MPDAEQQSLLTQRICDLPLKIEGSRLEEPISRLYRELEEAGISLKPETYLSDGWGCPSLVPVIGIPFYLADESLCELKDRLTALEAENDAEISMILRHESGHAFSYAYRIFKEPGWEELFGLFSRPYEEEYKPVPFSTRFVRHVAGWYVQKHPEEDFAETFAVRLTPGSEWQIRYADTPALEKLLFVDTMFGKYGSQPPLVTGGDLDMPVGNMTMSLESWFRQHKEGYGVQIQLHDIINEDLRRLFPAKTGLSPVSILAANQRQIIRNVHYWTGIDRDILAALVDELLERIRLLELKAAADQAENVLPGMSVFITTLVMNFLHSGEFIDS